jgi:hypothetical protein
MWAVWHAPVGAVRVRSFAPPIGADMGEVPVGVLTPFRSTL